MKLITLPLPLPSTITLLSPKPQLLRFKFKPQSSLQTTINPPKSPFPPNPKSPVIIIGGGLAAATHLNSQNTPFILLEASDSVGGRVRTDVVDGFLLDRGFQIFITAYPEAQKLLDYQSLDLQKFYSGARIYYGGSFHTVADPLRDFWNSVKSLANPIGSIPDKLLIVLTRFRVLTKSDEEIFSSGDEVSTVELLRGIGFSDSIIARFFQPFFGRIGSLEETLDQIISYLFDTFHKSEM